MKKLLTGAVVALGMSTAPLAHAAAPARATAPIVSASELGGGEPAAPLILALIIAAATIYLLVEQGDDDPDSP